MDKLKKRVLKLMLDNRRQAGHYQYTVPSPDSYPFQWLWDSCFHAIILCHFSVDDAKKELLSLVSKQFANGLIPHMIYWQKPAQLDFPIINWGKTDTSSLTQPPMLSCAAFKIFQTDRDQKFLVTIYPHLKKFYHYLLTERDPRGNHLAGIINPDESGEDNSPRFDQALKLSPQHAQKENFRRRLNLIEKNRRCNFDAPFCMKNFFWVKDVPFNAILVENLYRLADIASMLGLANDADLFFFQAQTISQAMRKLMLGDGIFWSTYSAKYQKIKTRTWAIFAPLFGRIATKEEADQLVTDYLLNQEEFHCPYLLPTVSVADPAFDPQGFWRGPIWMATNWLVFTGLKKYGYLKEAQQILNSSLKLIKQSGFREQYHPLTGDGQGASNFTWGGLIIDMLTS